MRIIDRAVYVGPSLYAHFPVIRLEIDLGPLEEWPSAKLGPAFIDRLIEALPGLQEHGCSYGEPGGFIRRLREDEGTWMGHILEHVAIELQNVAGEPVTFGPTARCPRTSTSPPSGTSSSGSPSGARWVPAPCRWCARRRSAGSRGSGSTSRV